MKIFDVHIGLSDAMVLLKKNPSKAGSTLRGLFPNQFDFIRAKKGQLDLFAGMICPIVIKNNDFILPENSKKEILKHINAYQELEKNKKIKIVKNSTDLDGKKLKVILGLEGVYFIKSEKDLEFLKFIISLGVKLIGPVWNFPSNLFIRDKISKLGQKLLEICQKNKIIIDLAHAESTIFDTIAGAYEGSVVDTHTCLNELYKHRRNITKLQVKKIIAKKGIIGLSFVGSFMRKNTLECVYEQITKFLDEFGDKNLSIGSDFDGMDKEDLIFGLEDVSKYPGLTVAGTLKINQLV